MSLEEKREAARDFESDAKRRRGDDSNSDVSRDDSLDMFYNTPGDSKDGEDFFPLAKKSDRKKRQYRGMAEDNSMSEKKERSDREHRRERSNKDRRERDLPSSRGWGESDGRERSGRSSGRRSPYSRSHRDRGRHRDRDRYDRDGDSYRRDDWSQGGDRDSRRGLDRDRLRVNRDREDQHGSSASSGRNKRSPYIEEPGQHSRRHRRDERGERDRERRNMYQDRERKWRGSRPVSDHSAVERRVSGSETSDNSGEEEDNRGRRVELRPESIENLIRDLEERRRFTGDSGSEVSSGSSTHSDRLRRGSNIHYEDGQLSPGGRSGSVSSGESGHSYNGSNRRHSRPYSLSPRSRSRSPIGNHENSMPGHPMRSKFDSTEYSGDEAGDEVLGDERGILSHPERTDSEELAVTGEHKNTNDQEIENERLSAQFVKDIEEEEVGEMDGVFGDLPIYYPALMGCRNVETYEWLNRIEEGTYGVVHRGKDKRTGEIVALKKLKMEKEREGFPITSLREINMLLKAKHPNIVHVKEIVVGSNMDKIFIVMEYVEHDLKNLMESMSQPFRPGEVKTLTRQLLSAVNHLHDNWILHRDLKASNLLLSHKGILKVGDFGLAREYGSPLKPYTPVVVTLWYRCPELLLGEKEYSTAVDMWSVGCIFAEFIQKEPLFKGRSEIDMLNLIFKELGTPSERIWPGYNKLPTVEKVTFTNHPFNVLRKKFPVNVLSENGFELLNRFLTYDPKKRVNAYDAMQHQYFKEPPMPIPPSMFPTWPAKSERTKTATKREKSPKPPSGGQNNIFNNDDDKIGPGFNLKMNP